MNKWEYLMVRLDTPGEPVSVATLDEHGQLGWEAVGLSPVTGGGCAVLMKRPWVSVGHTSGGRV